MFPFDLEPLRRLVGGLHPGPVLFEPVAMPGGASTRRYFRVSLPGGSSAVGMFVPDASTPDEIDHGKKSKRWPFLEVRDLLEARGVRVPVVLAENTNCGWLLIEDLGDDTLAEYLKRYPDEKRELYTQAVTDLARAHLTLGDLPEGSIVRERAFDESLLRWEIEHFKEWALAGRGISLSVEQSALFDRIASVLARKVAGFAQTFVHRDYQSRNLMVRRTESGPCLVWIDFQDALMGPRVYDLVALLGDSYQEFDREFIEERLDEFAAASKFGKEERKLLGREFDYVTVQRKLKDAGRFVFIDKVKGNPNFLPYVTPTIHKVKRALERLADDPDMRELEQLLADVLPQEMAP